MNTFKAIIAIAAIMAATSCNRANDALSKMQHEKIAKMANDYKGDVQYGASFIALDPSLNANGMPKNPEYNEKDEFSGLPRKPGYEETFLACSVCHSMRLVMQQNKDKTGWDSVIDTMVKQRGMFEPEKADREKITTYLGENFGIGDFGKVKQAK